MEKKSGENRTAITEEQGIHKEWMEETKDITMEKLPEFLRKLTEDYNHDYGTICHAISAAAIAAARSVDRSDQGGITGFQAGCIMWGFIREWMYPNNKLGLRIQDYDNLLYPQYEKSFTTLELTADQHQKLVETAKQNLLSDRSAADTVIAYWEKLSKGYLPDGISVEKSEDESTS